MKIFNVGVRVTIQQVGEIPDLPDLPDPPKEKFNDDPIDKADKMLTKHFERLGIGNAVRPGIFVASGPYGPESDGASMSRTVRITAETLKELTIVLAMFEDTINALNAVPDSVLSAHNQKFSPIG